VLHAQSEAWNRGDVDAFMAAGYWPSPELTFYSQGSVTRGYDAVLERYRKRYKSEGAEMGHLEFSAIEVQPLGAGAACARGRWDLSFGAKPPVGGLFLDVGAIDAITGGPFLIDHDQKLQMQTGWSYELGKSGFWVGTNVRYDSGLVTDADPASLRSDPDNSFAAGFVTVHSGGSLDPNRIKARTITDFSAGVDLAKHKVPVSVQVDLLNAFDEAGVYNIQSVFGGTHVIPPRTVAARIRYHF